MVMILVFGLAIARLNRNIGCIEILLAFFIPPYCYQLNRNIGCIEIILTSSKPKSINALNRNIGCIEISEKINNQASET